jgi:hypothetical protein
MAQKVLFCSGGGGTVKLVLNGPFIQWNFLLKGNIFRSITGLSGLSQYTLIKRKPGFSGKMFWTPEIPFKTVYTLPHAYSWLSS